LKNCGIEWSMIVPRLGATTRSHFVLSLTFNQGARYA
jgi:hypothetical protein